MVEKLFLKNPLQDLLSSLNDVISTNESTEFITGHVIYNPAYTYKFQLKTTFHYLNRKSIQCFSTFFYADLHQFIYLNLSATVVLLFFEVKAKIIIIIKALTLIIVGM